MYYNIEYSVCYIQNPISEERLCLGVIINEKIERKTRFVHIKDFNRLRVFNDEIDCEAVERYLGELQTAVEAEDNRPFIIEKYMQSPFAMIKFSEIRYHHLWEGSDYVDIIARTYMSEDCRKQKQVIV